MKNTLFSFAALSVLVAMPSFADDPVPTPPVPSPTPVVLATQGYVDAGLQYVYRQAKTMNDTTNGELDTLTLYVGAPDDGTSGTDHPSLTAQMADLAAGLDSMEEKVSYTGDGRGVLVTANRKISISGLNSDTGIDDKAYVFRNNMASELKMADTWSIPPVEPTPEP